MKKYYLNSEPQKNRDYEVHEEKCSFLPNRDQLIFLGQFYNCEEAVAEAKTRYPKAKIDGCYFCSKECHTS